MRCFTQDGVTLFTCPQKVPLRSECACPEAEGRGVREGRLTPEWCLTNRIMRSGLEGA